VVYHISSWTIFFIYLVVIPLTRVFYFNKLYCISRDEREMVLSDIRKIYDDPAHTKKDNSYTQTLILFINSLENSALANTFYIEKKQFYHSHVTNYKGKKLNLPKKTKAI